MEYDRGKWIATEHMYILTEWFLYNTYMRFYAYDKLNHQVKFINFVLFMLVRRLSMQLSAMVLCISL